MGHIFRIKKAGAVSSKSTIVDWSNSSATTYNHGYVDGINDTTTTQNEITSIPSPFARIELVKEAFGKIVPETLNQISVDEVKNYLSGKSIYHKMVSDSLDVAQIFFSYPTMQDKVEIVVWNKDKELQKLKASPNPNHQIVGKTLDMFLKQDALGNDPYNFGKMNNLYILKYKGPGQKQMHIIGATSPATLFFSTANDEINISKYICFGTDYAFDSAYSSLDKRDPEFIKYLFAFKYSNPNFNQDYPEVSKYMDAVYYVLDNDLKNEINNIQNQCTITVPGTQNYIDKNYESLNVDVNTTTIFGVEINGVSFHCKKTMVKGNSDFEIVPQKNTEVKPLVLPVVKGNTYENLEYYGSKFGRNFDIPYFDASPLAERRLPGINIQHPYLTISDFLEDKIVKLPSEINKNDYFDGNYYSSNGKKEGYLLPIKDCFLEYFNSDYLLGLAPSGKKSFEIKQVASGVEVVLRIPITGGEVEYKRIYTQDVKADAPNNKGAIVVPDEDLAIGVFPPVKFNQESDAHYRIIILSDYAVNKDCSCICYRNDKGAFVPDYVSRNIDVQEEQSSKVYLLDGKTFDCARITLVSETGKERVGNGLMIPKFKQRSGSTSLTFAIDLGTSNTHIEYSSGDNQLPKPFEFSTDQTQLSLLFMTDSALVLDHIRGEFIPESIGVNANCRFPMRTVLCIDKVNSGYNSTGTGKYEPFGNASPAFMYNQKLVGTKYNEYVPNLKWSQANPINEERIRCYIESLFLMIRTKVVQEGASIQQTQIKWFYPISMSAFKKGLFERIWTAAYKKYFNPTGVPTAITESVAPYSFFQKTRSDVTNIVTIDIGGGTTDIVVADSNGVKCISSMRFAADAIFGNSLVSVQNGELNGIIRQCKDEFISKLEGESQLQDMLIQKTLNNFGNSSEVASFLFSLADNEKIKAKGMCDSLDFNAYLTRNNSQKIVFFIFYTSIIYHLAHLMKAKDLEVPGNIAFSGNGSKVVTVLSPNKSSLEKLTKHIFRLVYDSDIDKDIKLIINSENPKEATCKGGLFLNHEPSNIDSAKSILIGVSKEVLCNQETYSDAQNMYEDVVKDVRTYFNFIALKLARIQGFSLSNEFGIDKQHLDLAAKCFNENLSTYVEKGIRLKLDTSDVSLDDKLEEPLFFYPIIGVLNDLSNRICDDKQ